MHNSQVHRKRPVGSESFFGVGQPECTAAYLSAERRRVRRGADFAEERGEATIHRTDLLQLLHGTGTKVHV